MLAVHIDIESYSELDLADVGVYAYAQHPSTEILCLCYAIGAGPTRRWLPGQPIPADLMDAMLAGARLRAWNSNFERVMLTEHPGKTFGFPATRIEDWDCTMVLSAYNGLPKGLDDCAKEMSLPGKDAEGTKVMPKLCKPKRPTKKDPTTRYLPSTHPELFEKLYAYCEQDVVVERSIHGRLPAMPDVERRLHWLDQEINDRGVPVDMALVNRVCDLIDQKASEFEQNAVAICGFSTTQRDEVMAWCASRGVYLDAYRKDDIAAALKRRDLPSDVREVLEIRRDARRAASGSKFYAAQRAVSRGNRLRGMFRHFGAVPTGRWAGAIVQLQNLSNQGYPESAPDDVIRFDLPEIELMYGDAMPLFGDMTRAMIVPSEGRRLIGGDFKAIEARVLAWMADEDWRMEVFRTHGMIYEASASQMFGIPFSDFVEHKKRTKEHHPLRKKGKVAELALGYYGGVQALINMGALKEGLKEEELQPIVDAWRRANPNIRKMWWAIQKAAVDAVDHPGQVYAAGKCHFKCDGQWLMIRLPSGRVMRYWKPELEEYESPWGKKKQLSYMGERQIEGSTKRVWCRVETHGGKLTENIDQGIARDGLREALFRLCDRGYREMIIGHVHDEGILDVPFGFGSCEEVAEIFAEPLPWAPTLPLGASVSEMMRYMKD